MIVLWPVAWLAAWWCWPSAPRAGWQIPAEERAVGFLSDSEHVLTRDQDGGMRVRAIEGGSTIAGYDCDKDRFLRVLGDFLIASRRHKEKPVEYPPGGAAGEVNLAHLEVREAWTGEIRFSEESIHDLYLPECLPESIVAYVRHDDAQALPEVVWRDLRSGAVLRRFRGLAGPLDFSPSGQRFLAARWEPDNPTYTLLLFEVPTGKMLHSVAVPSEKYARFSARLSDSDRSVLIRWHDVYDWHSGQLVLDGKKQWSGGLATLSSNGKYLIQTTSGFRNEVVWRRVESAQEEKRVLLANGEGRSGRFGRFDHRHFQWANVGMTYQPQLTWRRPFLFVNNWLPQYERMAFLIADQNTGAIIAQGHGHDPSHVSPDGKLLIMREQHSNRELIWNIPLDAGLSLPTAVLAALSLPLVYVASKRWLRSTR